MFHKKSYLLIQQYWQISDGQGFKYMKQKFLDSVKIAM